MVKNNKYTNISSNELLTDKLSASFCLNPEKSIKNLETWQNLNVAYIE